MTLDEAAPAPLTDGWKANVDDSYAQPDPRRYLEAHGALHTEFYRSRTTAEVAAQSLASPVPA